MFLHINKLGHKCEDLPPMVLNSPGSRASESSELAAETDEPEAAAEHGLCTSAAAQKKL